MREVPRPRAALYNKSVRKTQHKTEAYRLSAYETVWRRYALYRVPSTCHILLKEYRTTTGKSRQSYVVCEVVVRSWRSHQTSVNLPGRPLPWGWFHRIRVDAVVEIYLDVGNPSICQWSFSEDRRRRASRGCRHGHVSRLTGSTTQRRAVRFSLTTT